MRMLSRCAIPVALVTFAFGIVDRAHADRIAPSPPGQRAITAETVVVGKVVGFEKDPVQAAPYPGAKEKANYKVAVVKIQEGLIGAEKLKEIKVGFIAPKAGQPQRIFGVDLKEGQELLLFLSKHPSGDFHVIPGIALPVELKDEQSKKDLESVKKIAAMLADPKPGLGCDNPDIRSETASVVILKYRAYPALGGEVDQVAINADESKLLLKGISDGNWSSRNMRFDSPPSPLQAFQSLGLTAKDGWIQPVIVNTPGAPPADFGSIQKDAFMKWLEGPGKDYQIKKLVPKSKK